MFQPNHLVISTAPEWGNLWKILKRLHINFQLRCLTLETVGPWASQIIWNWFWCSGLIKLESSLEWCPLYSFTCTVNWRVKIRTSGLSPAKILRPSQVLVRTRVAASPPLSMKLTSSPTAAVPGTVCPNLSGWKKDELQGMQISSVQTQRWTQQKQDGTEWSCSCYCCCVVMFYFTTNTMLK